MAVACMTQRNMKCGQDKLDLHEPEKKRQKFSPDHKEINGSEVIHKFSQRATDVKVRDFHLRPRSTSPLKAPLVNGRGASVSQSGKTEKDFTPHSEDCETNFTPEKIPLLRNVLYRFKCPSAGAYRCNATGLVFVVTKEAELQYRIVQWGAGLRKVSGRTPAGPLYDLECPERAVCELHLPHCEPETVNVSKSQLSVAHLSDGDVEFIKPVRITSSHVVIKVLKLSLYGLADDFAENKNVSAQVLIFRTPKSWDVIKLNVFLLPRNIALDVVKCNQLSTTCIIDAPSQCTLVKNRHYTVICPSAEIVQPERTLFDMDFAPNYSSMIELRLPKKTIKASVTVQEEGNSNGVVWKHEVYLTDPTCRVPRTHPRKLLLQNLNLLRPSIIENVTDPVLDKLLDRLRAKRYLMQEEVDTMRPKPRADKAREVVDTVIMKGSRAVEFFMRAHCRLDKKSKLSRKMRKILAET